MEITASQAAALIGKSERTIVRWIKQGKLPAHQLTDKSYRVKVEDLEKFQQQSDETMLARIEVLEQEVAELKRQIATLLLPQPAPKIAAPIIHWEMPRQPAHAPGVVAASAFAAHHRVGKDRMATWIKRGTIPSTSEPFGAILHYNLTREQQAGAIAYWESIGFPYQRCKDCPHISG